MKKYNFLKYVHLKRWNSYWYQIKEILDLNPSTVLEIGPGNNYIRHVLTEEGIETRDSWMLKSEDNWHGFNQLSEGFNMLDPIKATIITPGLNMKGDFDEKLGIPASIVTKYLAEHGVIVEKTGLYSFFIMFTIGITKGRWNTLLAALQQFKDDYDRNQPIWRVLPEFTQKFPFGTLH